MLKPLPETDTNPLCESIVVDKWQSMIKEDYDCYKSDIAIQADVIGMICKCESPIESLLLWEFMRQWMLDCDPDDNETICLVPQVHFPVEYRYSPLYFYVQYPIKTDKQNYRADFIIRGYDSHIHDWFQWVIEVDGHDFHEKTKEQSQRDKLRDRTIQNSGYRILRYTGSEVWKNPGAIVTEITAALQG